MNISAISDLFFSMFQCFPQMQAYHKMKKNRTFLHCHKIELGVKKLKIFVFVFSIFFFAGKLLPFKSNLSHNQFWFVPKLYIPSTLNNSNETHTFMCLGRAGRFGQH